MCIRDSNIPHGIACGITIPYVIDYNLPASTDALAMVAKLIGQKTRGLSEREVACKAVKAAKALLEDIELPLSLGEVDVPRDDLDEIARLIVEERQFPYQLPSINPRKLTMKNVTDLLKRMWNGEFEHR